MEKKKVAADNPVSVAGITLIPVIKVSLRYWSTKGGDSFFGVKQHVAMVVVSQSAKRAFWITGEEVSLEELIKEAPSLKEILE